MKRLFSVNTKKRLSLVLKVSAILLVLRTHEITDIFNTFNEIYLVFNTFDEIYLVFTAKSKYPLRAALLTFLNKIFMVLQIRYFVWDSTFKLTQAVLEQRG